MPSIRRGLHLQKKKRLLWDPPSLKKSMSNIIIIHFHVVSESFPKKTLQISVEKEGLALLYINKAQTKSPTHHQYTTDTSSMLDG